MPEKLTRVRPPALVRSSSAPLPSACHPSGTSSAERPARLQIRLVEAGEGLVGARGHEDRVEELVVAIERSIPGVELERQAVFPGAERAGGDDDVAVHLPRGGGDAVGRDRLAAIPRDREGSRGRADRPPTVSVNVITRAAADRLRPCGRNRERQLVAEVRDPGGALARESFADAGLGIAAAASRRPAVRSERASRHHLIIGSLRSVSGRG